MRDLTREEISDLLYKTLIISSTPLLLGDIFVLAVCGQVYVQSFLEAHRPGAPRSGEPRGERWREVCEERRDFRAWFEVIPAAEFYEVMRLYSPHVVQEAPFVLRSLEVLFDTRPVDEAVLDAVRVIPMEVDPRNKSLCLGLHIREACDLVLTNNDKVLEEIGRAVRAKLSLNRGEISHLLTNALKLGDRDTVWARYIPRHLVFDLDFRVPSSELVAELAPQGKYSELLVYIKVFSARHCLVKLGTNQVAEQWPLFARYSESRDIERRTKELLILGHSPLLEAFLRSVSSINPRRRD